MNNKLKHQFKYPSDYYKAFMNLFTPLLLEDEYHNTAIEDLNNRYARFSKRVLRDLRDLMQKEATFNARMIDSLNHQTTSEFLLHLLPSLSLKRSPQLMLKLDALGFNQELKEHFISKRQLDEAILKMIKDTEASELAHSAVIILSYWIAYEKCRLFTEEALGLIYTSPSGTYVTRTKHEGEKLYRKYRNNSLISNPAPEDQKVLNSNFGKHLFNSGNIIARRNKQGTYNIEFLAHLIFKAIREQTDETVSDTAIILELYEVFKILYREKNLIWNEQEYLICEGETDKHVSGIDFTDYRLIQVRSIIYYQDSKQFDSRSTRYENPENIDIKEVWNSLLDL